MTTELQRWLGQNDGLHEFDHWFKKLMRSGGHDELDTFLTEELLAHPHRISSLCLSRPLSKVHITGWNELAINLLREEKHNPPKKPVTAIGANLSMHCDPDDDVWPLEVSLYDDDAFSFGAGNIDAINAEAAKATSAWQGCFRDISHSLAIVGLGRIYSLLSTNPVCLPTIGEPASIDEVADRLGHHFLTLRFHQALVRDAAHEGLIRPMILLGGAHDIPPFFEAAYQCDAVYDDRKLRSALDAVSEEDKAGFRERTTDTVEEWRRRRDTIIRRRIPKLLREQFANQSAARDASFFEATGVGDGRPMHELSDHEFELLVYAWCRLRAKEIGDDPDAIPFPRKQRGGLFRLFSRAR